MTGNGAGPNGTGTVTDTGPNVNDPHFGEQGGLLTYGGYLRLPELLEVPAHDIDQRIELQLLVRKVFLVETPQ